MCGLYALTDPADRRLDFRADQAVGAIAAWGDMEVHRTGFRASHACVTALAMPDGAGYEMREALARAGAPLRRAAGGRGRAQRRGAAPRRAAARGDVPGRAGARGLAGPPPRRRPALRAPRGAAGRPGRLRHRVARDRARRAPVGRDRAGRRRRRADQRAGVADSARRRRSRCPSRARRWRPATSSRPSATGDGTTFGIWAPVGGAVLAVNPKLADDPGLLARDPEGAGWLLRLAPRDWERRGRRGHLGRRGPPPLRGDAGARRDRARRRVRRRPPGAPARAAAGALRRRRPRACCAPSATRRGSPTRPRSTRSWAAGSATRWTPAPSVRERLDRLGLTVRFRCASPRRADARLRGRRRPGAVLHRRGRLPLVHRQARPVGGAARRRPDVLRRPGHDAARARVVEVLADRAVGARPVVGALQRGRKPSSAANASASSVTPASTRMIARTSSAGSASR